MYDTNDVFNLLAYLLIDLNKYGSDVFKNFIDEKYEEIITCDDNELENIFNEIIFLNIKENLFKLKNKWLLYAKFMFLVDRISGQESIFRTAQQNTSSLNNKYKEEIEIYPAYETIPRFKHSSSNFYYFLRI